MEMLFLLHDRVSPVMLQFVTTRTQTWFLHSLVCHQMCVEAFFVLALESGPPQVFRSGHSTD
jgi:hypothetical protein